MPPQSRGKATPSGFQSKSTPNLPTLRALRNSETVASLADSLSTTNVLSPDPIAPSSKAASAAGHIQDEIEEVTTLDPSDGSDSDDLHDAPPTARPLYTSRSQTHLPPHASSMFFPPFYNRPPTPLPPSPSLTSLLRPSFSTPASRPSTPDSSDVDLPVGTGTGTNGTTTPASTANLISITKSARHAPMVPRASPKVPTYEYYGFALYLASSAAFLLYIVWAYVPSPLLHQMGIHYYPNRWWALAVPCWLVVLVIYIYVALASYNTRHLTLPLSSCENLVDECAQVAVVDRRTGNIARDQIAGTNMQAKDKGATGSAAGSRRNSASAYQFSPTEEVDWKAFWSISTDAVMDVPIGGVCEILYGGEG